MLTLLPVINYNGPCRALIVGKHRGLINILFLQHPAPFSDCGDEKSVGSEKNTPAGFISFDFA